MLPWSVKDYAKALGKRGCTEEVLEEELHAAFPSGLDPDGGDLADKPGIIVDLEGNILVWILPGVISGEAQVCQFT